MLLQSTYVYDDVIPDILDHTMADYSSAAQRKFKKENILESFLRDKKSRNGKILHTRPRSSLPMLTLYFLLNVLRSMFYKTPFLNSFVAYFQVREKLLSRYYYKLQCAQDFQYYLWHSFSPLFFLSLVWTPHLASC